MSKPPAGPRVLDEKKLLSLNPPLTVNVYRRGMGNRTSPIPLPPAKMDPNFEPGKGYDHTDVRALSNVLLQVAGGGFYGVSLSDDSGNTHEFDIWLDPSSYPEKTPAEFAQHAKAPVIPITQAQPQPQAQVQPMPAVAMGAGGQVLDWVSMIPPGIPRTAPMMAAMPPQMQQPAGYDQGFYAPRGQWGYAPTLDAYGRPASAWPAASQPAPAVDDGKKALEEQIRLLREEKLIRESAAAREREIAALNAEVRKLAERPQPEPPKNDEMLAMLRDELRELKASKQNDGITQMMMMMQQQQRADADRAAQQAAQQAQQFQTLITTLMGTMSSAMAKPTGPDPSLMMIIEMFRQSSEMGKETVRTIAEGARERERTAIGFRDVVELTQKMNDSNGAGNLLKGVGEAYQAVLGMAKAQVELMRESVGGGPGPVQELVGTALQRAGDIAQNYIQMKRDVAVGEARAAAAASQAQAAASGNVVPIRPATPAGVAPAQAVAAPPPPAPKPIVPPSGMSARDQQILEHEIKIFGPAIEAIQQLRTAVQSGKVKNPAEVVQFFFQGISVAQTRGWVVPVFDLFLQDQLNEFVETILPNAPKDFIIETVRLLYAAKQAGGPPPVGVTPTPAPAPAPTVEQDDDGDEDDEDDEDDDDDEDEVPHS